MYTFDQNLHAIASYPVTTAKRWYDYCDLVAAVAANEILNNPSYSPMASAQQAPACMIAAVTKLRNSGYALLQQTDMKQLTAPPNHFSALISTLKVYGAPRTANAVKGTALLFWVHIESVASEGAAESPAAASSGSAAASVSAAASDFASAPAMHKVPAMITEDLSTTMGQTSVISKPVAIGIGITSLVGAYLLWNKLKED
jgi:hypothetical protein